MRIDGIVQPPFETTMMGVVKGVLDHFGRDLSPARVYGGSGHAFLVNVHEALCPSGPYCWNEAHMEPLLRNLGLGRTDLGFYHAGSPPEERAAVEAKLLDHLRSGRPCSLVNMEHQIVYGFEDGRFLTARPWSGNPDFPPGTLTPGDWTELGAEIHMNFFAYDPVEPADPAVTVRASLEYAVDVHRHPGKHQCEGYAVGPGAWDNWAAAAGEFGASHGNWWNGTVWGECRLRAAEYLDELAESLDGDAASRAGSLAAAYAGIAEQVAALADKELPADKKRAIALDVKSREEAAILGMEALLDVL